MLTDSHGRSKPGAAPGALIVYHHIPKTAGASLRLVVKQNYPPEALLEGYGAPARNDWYHLWWHSFTAEEKAAARCVAGHTTNHLLPALDRPFRVLTLLRDPVERVISLYYYLLERYEFMRAQAPRGGRMGRATAGLIERRGWTLEDIYRRFGDGQREASTNNELFGPFFNGQLRALAGPHSTAADIRYAKDWWPEGGLQLESVISYMEQNYEVGLQEALAWSIDRFAQTFGWQHVFKPRVNITTREGRHDVSDKTRELIRRYNALDIRLHEHFREAMRDDRGPSV